MSGDKSIVYIDFHTQANQSFFALEEDFLAATESLNREEEEFRFQQLKKDYVNELKQQLEMSAQELMNKNRLTNAAGQELNLFIKEYLHQFVQKINAY